MVALMMICLSRCECFILVIALSFVSKAYPNFACSSSVWSEEASSPGCLNCVLHDLDLTVTLGGVTYYPNNLGQPDRRNNAERVIINSVQSGDVATITVTAHNLARYEQKYSLVATGCFGGVANQLYANGECSVFECDNSKSRRTTIILSAIFVPLAVILLSFVGKKMLDKKRALNKHVDGHSDNNERIEEGISVMDGRSIAGGESQTSGHGAAKSHQSDHHKESSDDIGSKKSDDVAQDHHHKH